MVENPITIEQKFEEWSSELQNFVRIGDEQSSLTDRLENEPPCPIPGLDVIIQQENGQTSILLGSKKKQFNLARLLPKGWKFDLGERDNCDWVNTTVVVNQKSLERRYVVLAVLHEIGHTHDRKSARALHAIEQITQANNNHPFTLTAQEEIGSFNKFIPDEGFLPESLIQTAHENNTLAERRAWAFALSRARKLMRRGYSVLSGFGNIHNVVEHAHDCMQTHDLHWQKIASAARLVSLTRAVGVKYIRERLLNSTQAQSQQFA